jgi:diketogulonate reductase-like aldo/keto reductase
MEHTYYPLIGIGTNLSAYKSESISTLLEIIKDGIQLGYRFIDTGDIIHTDTTQIFETISASRIKRKDLFISTRVYDYTTPEDFKLRIGDLKYVDLCNFGNAPITVSRSTFDNVVLKIWAGMVLLKENGLVKELGIINFHYRQVEILLQLLTDKGMELPTVAYVEIHPLNLQERLIQLYHKYRIHVIAYSPLGSNGHHIYADHDIIDTVRADLGAENYTQTLLAITLARGISVVPKTLNIEHLKQNLKSLQYVSKVTQSHLDMIAEINLDSPLNNDTSNSIAANNRIL